MKNFYKNLYLVLFLSKSILADTTNFYFKEQPRWNENLDFENIEYRLKNEKIIAIKHLSSNNDPTFDLSLTSNFNVQNIPGFEGRKIYFVLLESGLKAIFKAYNTMFGEVAAYKANKFLKFNLVPPTVIRNINGTLGNLKFFIEPTLEQNDTIAEINNLDEKTKNDLALFLFLFWGSDTHFGNKLIQKNDKTLNFALIDNERLFKLFKVKYGNIPYWLWGKDNTNNNYLTVKFPHDQTKTILKKDKVNLKKIFGKFIDQALIDNLEKWLNEYQYINYIIWQSSLWIQDHYNIIKINKINKNALTPLRNLDFNTLLKIYDDVFIYGSEQDKNKCYKVISDILERRNQILKLYNIL